MRLVLALVVLLGLSGSSYAQEPNPLRLSDGERIAARLTDAGVGLQLGFAIRDAWQAEDRGKAFGCLALENGLTLGLTELVKRTVRRERPDASDRLSFPSGHSAMAAVNARGWRWSLAVNVPIGRQMAGKHWPSDTIAGFALGASIGRICR